MKLNIEEAKEKLGKALYDAYESSKIIKTKDYVKMQSLSSVKDFSELANYINYFIKKIERNRKEKDGAFPYLFVAMELTEFLNEFYE